VLMSGAVAFLILIDKRLCWIGRQDVAHECLRPIRLSHDYTCPLVMNVMAAMM
jgi:hypothetical protein